jgi:tetratricopeptide (TPR) repeat protein
MSAIQRSRKASPGSLQHVVLYGSRGFGKSFMTRKVQIAAAQLPDDGRGPVLYVLLPEEQDNIQRNPHALLDTVRIKLANLRASGDSAYEEAHFFWPKPDMAAKFWDEATKNLEAALDTALPAGQGLVVVAVENFDIMLATLFRDEEDEQRLRLWLDRPGNRVMLLATATGTVDMDYDRPLFQAFEPIRLPPWTPDECIAYFNRRRKEEGKSDLAGEQLAKARAIADFIGGTPRLAQLLAAVLDSQDALAVADAMTALADRLADYYRRRIEDLPILARGLLDAMIRGGEPASATALAQRVEADGQSAIARVMADLQRADIIRGRPAPDSKETLYFVTDRVFVHYYRLRQGSRAANETPLATILDFLKSFYTRDEQRAQAIAHMGAGRLAEAGLFRRLAQDGEARAKNRYTHRFAARLDRYCGAAPDLFPDCGADLLKRLEEEPETVWLDCPSPPFAPSGDAIVATIRAQVFYRMGDPQRAREALEQALDAARGDATAQAILNWDLSILILNHFADRAGAARIAMRLPGPPQVHQIPPRLAVVCLYGQGWALQETGRYDDSIRISRAAAEGAERLGDAGMQASSLRIMAFALSKLGRHEEAVETATRAAAVAGQAEDKAEQATVLNYMAYALNELGRHEEAVETATRAAGVAEQGGDKAEQAIALKYMAFSLGKLGRIEEAIETATRAAGHAEQAGDKAEQADALRLMADSLHHLGRETEAWTKASEAFALSCQIGDHFTATRAALRALFAARHFPRSEAVAIFAAWVTIWRENPEKAVFLADPTVELESLFSAAARASAFEELDALLRQHGDWLAANSQHIFLSWDFGKDLARILAEDGRAAAYQAISGLLPRLADFAAKREGEENFRWLLQALSGFMANCRDAGLLRDIADLLTGAPYLLALGTAILLRTLADFEEAGGTEKSLARVDPDLAVLIRRLRDLRDPSPPPEKRKSGRRTKMKG